MASRQRRELSNSDWENLCVLLQRARYEGRVSEALMEANVVAPSQLPLRPAPKTKAKAKPKAGQVVYNGEPPASASASSTMETSAMTDASKRLAPDGGFTAKETQGGLEHVRGLDCSICCIPDLICLEPVVTTLVQTCAAFKRHGRHWSKYFPNILPLPRRFGA